jgi:hypothetical protein
MPQAFDASLDLLADAWWWPAYSEHMPGSLHDLGCPNLDKASQNRAVRGMKQPGALE